MSSIPPDPGASSTESITPPFPIRVLEQLQEISRELDPLIKERPELAEVKADVDRAISRLVSLDQTA